MPTDTLTVAPDTKVRRQTLPTYVLITPARNEAAFIELTIKSVIKQTVLPLKWVIVSDGSTDGTDEIVQRYAARHAWIELVRMPERRERHFAGKVLAFNAGRDRVRDLNYDIIGNLDADISFDEDYFEFLLGKFAQDPHLGVGGTPFREGAAQYDYRFTSAEHVSGACQLFRRECFESIGGYVPIVVGGIDLVAVISARMKGWRTRSFPEKVSIHHKETQNRGDQHLRRIFRSGYHDYLMGSAAVWQIFRSGYQMARPPFVIGGSLLLAGYIWAMATRAKRPVPDELVSFRRNEQRHRLKTFLKDSFATRSSVARPEFRSLQVKKPMACRAFPCASASLPKPTLLSLGSVELDSPIDPVNPTDPTNSNGPSNPTNLASPHES